MTTAHEPLSPGEAGLTFMLTDVQGSTRMWERDPAAMRVAMARHDELIDQVVRRHGGELVRSRGEGDSSFSVFGNTAAAVSAAVDLQRALHAERWPTQQALRVRLGLHVGDAENRDGDYYGSAVNRCARLRALAAGGQSVLSAAAHARIAHDVPAGAYLVDLGSHRLRDMAEPERIYQLSHPDLPSDFPDLRGLETVPNNLPVQLSSFIGRDREVADLVDVLRGSRLVTLTGTGGCGKTRLALEVAAGVADKFEDGVWFVDLSSTSDPALIPNALATAIGVGEGPAGVGGAAASTLEEAVARHLADRRALLVLDNCEHLLPASAHMASHILAAARGVVILATSREVIGLPGEVAWRVPSLAVPDPARLPELDTFAGFEAVRLFVERARRHDRGFELGNENMAAIAQICSRVAGIPLALELAAARVRVLSVEQIAARLSDQFKLLSSSNPRAALSRQATLRATVDWSYNLLDPAEAAIFIRLAIFAGGWTLGAAETVCAGGLPGEEVLDLVGRLVDKSLVIRDALPGDPRFRLLEPLRQYGIEKLTESGDHDELRSEHLRYFAKLATHAGESLTGPNQGEALVLLDLEMDNVRAALEWGLGEHRAEALELAAGLRLYWLYRELFSEGRTWLDAALEACPDAAPSTRAQATMGAGRLALQMNDVSGARARHRRAQEIADQHRLGDEYAEATWRLGQVSWWEDDLDDAGALFADALALARGTGNEYLVAVTLIDSAQCALAAGRDCIDLAGEGLDLARRLGDDRNTATASSIRGRALVSVGRSADALADLSTAVAIFRRLGLKSQAAAALVQLGRLHTLAADTASAAAALGEALDLSRAADADDESALTLEAIAALNAAVGRDAAGVRILSSATVLRERAGLRRMASDAQQTDALRATLESRMGEEGYAAEEASAAMLSVDRIYEEARLALSF